MYAIRSYYECLMLVFDGDKSLGNWANARVIAESKREFV